MDVLDHADLAFPQSLPEFQRLFPDDAACAHYLEKARWGGGFICPHCQADGEPFRFDNRGNLKSWLNGIHHGVSAKHLQAYLNEFTFRFNRRFYPFNAFRSLLGIAGDATAPTYAELYLRRMEAP